MSLGPNAADSQWIYTHFAAKNSVVIRSGFSLAGNASMQISVGPAPAPLAKRGPAVPAPDNARVAAVEKSGFRLQGSSAAIFTLSSNARVTLEAFTLNGRRVATLLSENLPAGSHARSLKVSDLSRGLYLYRFTAGNVVQSQKVIIGQ
jgi:serine protease AprX